MRTITAKISSYKAISLSDQGLISKLPFQARFNIGLTKFLAEAGMPMRPNLFGVEPRCSTGTLSWRFDELEKVWEFVWSEDGQTAVGERKP